MRYRINQIKIKPEDVAAEVKGISEERLQKALRKAVLKKISGKSKKVKISNPEIVRESIDARKKPDVRLVYTVDFDCDISLDCDTATTVSYTAPEVCGSLKTKRPVIAGFGPCGIFTALILAEAGLRPIVIERGKAVDERISDVEAFWRRGENPDEESNVQFGEGGAGTFSDGKLTTGIRDIRIRKVLESFVEAGADKNILYSNRPHLGTDRLRDIVKNLRLRIEELGGEVRFNTRLDGINAEGGKVRSAFVTAASAEGRDSFEIETDWLVLAVGHSAGDTFRMLYESGYDMKQKQFSIGVRIEHPQELINKSQYGDESLAAILGPADYKLSYRFPEDGSSSVGGRGLYTFCMCPGGVVVNASTEAGTSVTNGMSRAARDSGTANSALLVDVRTSDFGSDHPLAGIEFQRKYERLAWENRTDRGMAVTTYGEFAGDRQGAEQGNPVRRCLPDFACEAMLEGIPRLAKKLKGFDREDAILTAVETRSSSPVRIVRDENMDCLIGGVPVKGIIPAGEGPGYAGGIMSAAVDGIRSAEMIINRSNTNK